MKHGKMTVQVDFDRSVIHTDSESRGMEKTRQADNSSVAKTQDESTDLRAALHSGAFSGGDLLVWWDSLSVVLPDVSCWMARKRIGWSGVGGLMGSLSCGRKDSMD